ncbi:hypothetical protein CDQ84_02605 [Clostridium thermosuccinogenes]|jgi:hypothetical protein|uniref:PrcB C-terminal domain-containing protein n=1 Tax=Clostridium thermosuccinogenes TaxID=84032 RepID=A0A2K2FQI9_9CLOT|nr:hypothetical protein [Pseudoclostridium thermosuccinogenes]AUS95964.1 hypothetical protein CDO33_05630 [Pseudoclostridium thermosuccinogenes]PNT99353.1 hypothetical protein CDQ85_02605 [Pseudoclostridium thermosuccinogenes]PNU01040.1 hypothetical protein CDQ84_02605 [Pseudoclostridium thermosuccinogenes]
MKKAHLILLVITSVMVLYSAYSLAAISQVYNIDFEWYSAYEGRFSDKSRDMSGTKRSLDTLPKDLLFEVITNEDDLLRLKNKGINTDASIDGTDFDEYILLFCSLGVVNSPEYGIKVEDIAQRGNSVEIKVGMIIPEESFSSFGDYRYTFMPADVVRIKKSSLSSRGNLIFIFKDRSGKPLAEVKCKIE